MLIFFSLVIIVKGLSVSLSVVEATKFIELIIFYLFFGGEGRGGVKELWTKPGQRWMTSKTWTKIQL